MQTYLVGGAVRDALLGLPVQDRDWVVVGATAQAMVAQGFLPVGRDFPVFLHPVTKEEYALARTERKTAPGYRGFVVHAAPDVTLEQDLARRDVTINSIAVITHSTRENGQFPDVIADFESLIDPFGGVADLHARLLRHTTAAFSEDPVRILRVARFAARFADFSVAPETMRLMQQMVASGEAGHLVPERVWQELAKGLMAARPSRMFEVLAQCGALAALWPGPDVGGHSGASGAGVDAATENANSEVASQLRALDAAAAANAMLPVRYACLCESLPGVATQPKVPRECAELAAMLSGLPPAQRQALMADASLDAENWMALLEHVDALRRPGRFADLLQVCGFVTAARLANPAQSPGSGLQTARAVLAAAQAVTIKSVANHADSTRGNSQIDGATLGRLLRQARLRAIQVLLAPPEPADLPLTRP